MSLVKTSPDFYSLKYRNDQETNSVLQMKNEFRAKKGFKLIFNVKQK